MNSDVILVIVVVTALVFDFTNGFHDTATAVATSISTRMLPPRVAVAGAAALNFAGAFLSLKVATTVGKGFVSTGALTASVVFAGLVGAIAWNLITWSYGLPSSSSHALIGGLVGAVLASSGSHAVSAAGLFDKLILPAVIAPILAFAAAGLGILLIYVIFGRRRPGPVNRGFRLAQLVSDGAPALSHGTNDAQKTMGVLTLALVANGDIPAHHFHVPLWVIVAAASAIGLGTFSGGWRIIKTMGTRIIKMEPAVMGAGAAKRVSAVRWGVAGDIVRAWLLTLPAAALMGAAVYGLESLSGSGVAGPVVISILLLALGLATVFAKRLQAPVATPTPSS